MRQVVGEPDLRVEGVALESLVELDYGRPLLTTTMTVPSIRMCVSPPIRMLSPVGRM